MMTDSIFPTSYAQRRLWFIQQMSPQSTAYNMVFSSPLRGPLDRMALQWALNALVKRHESLRTCFQFENGQPVQVVVEHGELVLEWHDMHDATQLKSIVSNSVAQAFDLTIAPLARVTLARLKDSRAILTFVMHHIIADGQTTRILMEDLEAIYHARIAGQIPFLPDQPIEYADCAVWQQRSLTGRRLEALTEYWKRRLHGLPELELHLDRPRPAHGSVRGSVVPLCIPSEMANRLRMLAGKSKTTLFSVLLTGLSVVLAHFSGQKSFPIGIPVSGRTKPELERVAGLFINSIVFQTEIDMDMSFEGLVRLVGVKLAEDLSHQDLPFELVVDVLNVYRRVDRNPLFQVMIQLYIPQGSTEAMQDEDESQLEPDNLTSQLDISFMLHETREGSIKGGAVFAADLFDSETIEQFVEAFVRILDEGSRDKTQPIGTMSILSARQRERILELGHGESRHSQHGMLLHEWFENRARHCPNSPAVEAHDASLTFEQLDRRSNHFAADLQKIGLPPGSIVAIYLPRSCAAVVAVLGVLKAGCAHLLLDTSSPTERLKFILSDCDAAAVVVPEGGMPWAFGRPFVELGNSDSGDTPVKSVARLPQDPAYVIYTSGSTGQPKGVIIPHRAIVNHMQWMLDRFPLGASDRVLQRTPLTFDASVWELWAPLLAGAVMVVAPPDGPFDPTPLIETILQNRITILQVVPSILRELLERPEIVRCTMLRRVFCGGEALTRDIQDQFFSSLPAELCNLYGPAETTIDATFHVCRRDAPPGPVPIGRPIANVMAHVMDSRMQPVPPGVVGELYIGGEAMGTGYIGLPELTAERFLDDPWHAGSKLFRTGDHVRMLRNGDLLFVGRKDHQIKLRGVRIELGEIESVLMTHPSVIEAAAVVQDHGAGDQRLVVFVAASSTDRTALTSELASWMRSRMPTYQQLSAIVVRSSLPKTAYGKIDRKMLAQADLAHSHRHLPASAPRNKMEQHISRCFVEILGVGEVHLDDDFFLMGGHSLLVIPVCEALKRLTGIDVSVVDVFEYPTARQLAAALAARKTLQNRDEDSGFQRISVAEKG